VWIIMSETAESSLRETLLRAIAGHGDGPWYSRDFAGQSGLSRDTLFSPLNDLRVAELVVLTEWERGAGQGYRVTDLGREVLNNPVFLAQLKAGRTEPPADALANTAVTGATALERGDAAREAVYGVRSTPITYGLIAANVICFLLAMAYAVKEGFPVLKFLGAGEIVSLAKFGAAGVPELARGEWYRLLFCCFLHSGLMHLTLNMASLYLSRRVESIWGSGRFLILYLICGICGSVTAVMVTPGSPVQPVYLVGASGALWGIMTSQMCWLYLNRRHFAPAEVQKWMTAVSYTLLLNIGVSMLPGVSMSAHLGGGLAGLIATPLLQIHRFGPAGKRLAAGVLLALLPSLFLVTLATAFEHDSRLKVFLDAEKQKTTDAPVEP